MKDEAFYRWIIFLKKIRFGWLAPFFLLLKGESPRDQLKAIFHGVALPLISVLVFFWLWDLTSRQIVTKFGTVPGPKQVWSAWKGLGNEKRLENIKEKEHAHRVRQKRLKSMDRYASVLEDFPGEIESGLTSPAVEAAMNQATELFERANELMQIYNRVSVAASLDEAKSTAEGLQFAESKELAGNIIAKVVPMEIAYRNHEEAYRADPKWNTLPGDTDAESNAKMDLNRSESRILAAEKVALLIERQKMTTQSTLKAFSLISSLPKGMRDHLASSDRAAATMYVPLKQWYEKVLVEEATGGAKYKNKVKLKMLLKAFENKVYTGKDTYVSQIYTSLTTVFFGFIIASVIAIPLGLLCGLNEGINNAMNPIIQIFKPVSPLAWLPIVMIVVGAVYVSDDPMFEISFLNSAITVALCSLWPTLVNTALGVSTTNKDYLNVALVLKLGWFKKITKIIIPAAMPLIFTGLRLSLGVGWMVLIAAEMLAQNPGLGKFVWDMFQNGSSETLSMIMVAVFTIGIIGFMLDTIMLSLQEFVSFE